MNTFKLEPGDILVNVDTGRSLFAIIKRWALGSPYSHVFMYLGQMSILVDNILLRHAMLFESAGRGVVLQSLCNRYGQKVVVMRLKSEYDRRRIPIILQEAVRLASDEKARYDYMCIPLNIIARILHDKFGMPLPAKYDRNEQMVCSEACAEVFWRAKVPVLPENVVPLPGDFVTSPLLEEVNRGILSQDWV